MQPLGIGEDRQRLARLGQLQLQALAGEAVAIAGGDPGQQRAEVELLLAVIEGAEVGEGELVEIVDQPAEVEDLAVQRADRRGGRLADPVLQRLDFAAQHGQRRAQLVGDVGDPLAPRRFVPFQGRGQQVEIPGQLPQLVAGGDRDAGRVVPGGEAMGGAGQGPQRPHQALGQGERDQRRNQQRDRRDQSQGELLLAHEAQLGEVEALRRLSQAEVADHRAVLVQRAQIVAPNRL